MSQTNSRNSHQKRELKLQLSSKHGNVCQICHKNFKLSILTIDHIIPLAAGGTWDFKNLQLACYKCNQEKADTYNDPWAIFDT